MQAAANVASYADALDVTENRMLSAIKEGDQSAFELQDAQLNKVARLLGQAHTALAQAETKWAGDIVNSGLNLSITPKQLADFVSQLSAGGVSALSPQERSILNSFTTNPTQQNAILQAVTSINLTGAPTDLVSALKLDANANNALGTLYSRPANPNAVANVHQPIITSNAVAITLTETGSTLTRTGDVAFMDANSTLSPTASVTANTVTATGKGLVLTSAQKTAFADAFHITNTNAGAWTFDLPPADSAFLIPRDSVKIVETVTVDDGQGGKATQNETFTILGSDEPPKITSGGGGSTATYIISEDTRFTTDVTASDPDRGDHVTYSIVGDTKHTPFTIDPQTGALFANHSLGGDEHWLADEKTRTVTVRATDSYGASTTQTLTVDVAHDHLMIGTNAADTFVFQPHFGFEVVKNFDPSHDALQFDSTTFSNAQEVLAHAKQVDNNVVITPATNAHDDRADGHGHDTIVLKGVQLASLRASDFTFVTLPNHEEDSAGIMDGAAARQLAQFTQAVGSFSPAGFGFPSPISQASNEHFGLTNHLAPPTTSHTG